MKMVSLAQLALLPIGTVVSLCQMGLDGKLMFDCQGVLLLHHKAKLSSVCDRWIDLTDETPDIRINGGRLESTESVHSLMVPGSVPWRFIIWDADNKADKAFSKGINAAADFIHNRASAYLDEHGSYDPYTGATELSVAGEEVVGEWEELAECIRGIRP